jgi:DNA-binding IclR family transcriptional regulator
MWCRLARPELEALAAATRVSAHLAIRAERDIVYLLHIPGTAGFISNISAGTRLPAHATPMGQILLSKLSRKDLFALYDGVPLPALTSKTPTSLADLAAAVARAGADGVIISRGSFEAGGISLAAPLADASGDIVAAIDISCPESAFEVAELETRYRTELLRAAERISRRLVPR